MHPKTLSAALLLALLAPALAAPLMFQHGVKSVGTSDGEPQTNAQGLVALSKEGTLKANNHHGDGETKGEKKKEIPFKLGAEPKKKSKEGEGEDGKNKAKSFKLANKAKEAEKAKKAKNNLVSEDDPKTKAESKTVNANADSESKAIDAHADAASKIRVGAQADAINAADVNDATRTAHGVAKAEEAEEAASEAGKEGKTGTRKR